MERELELSYFQPFVRFLDHTLWFRHFLALNAESVFSAWFFQSNNTELSIIERIFLQTHYAKKVFICIYKLCTFIMKQPSIFIIVHFDLSYECPSLPLNMDLLTWNNRFENLFVTLLLFPKYFPESLGRKVVGRNICFLFHFRLRLLPSKPIH